jgi:hypothetical protein
MSRVAEDDAMDAALRDPQALRDALRDLLDGAAVGSLLATVAHAGNNRLTVILSCLDLLAGADIADEDLRSAIALATGAAQQLASEFSALLEGERRGMRPAEEIGLGRTLRRVATLDAFLHGDDSIVITGEVPHGLDVDAERERLVATLLRLCTIARRRGARSIRIGAGALDIETRGADRPGLRKGRYCRLEIEIVGATWPGARASAEPGRVVAHLGEADGLELAAAEAFVAALRGHMAIRAGGGSTVVELCLPASRRGD